ncbi:Uncharacterised protein [Mycobacteroides abscessus subsp. abscessus]|nr:Uncharacterised protein [Mycobacteroides abscessus subsp. abscessus]
MGWGMGAGVGGVVGHAAEADPDIDHPTHGRGLVYVVEYEQL